MIKKILAVVICLIIICSCTIPIILDTKEEQLAIVVIEGQSNAGYWGNLGLDIMNDEIPLPENNVYYYGTKTGPMYTDWRDIQYDPTFKSYAIHSMVSNDKWKIGLIDAYIGYSIQKEYNIDVLVINAAISGISINLLLPDNQGGKYVQDVVTHAINEASKMGTIKKVGFIWIQGEADYGTPVNTYINKFSKIADMNKELGLDKGYIVETRSGNAATAQIKICDNNPNMILASTAPPSFTIENGLMLNDDVHYSGEGRLVVAKDIAEKIQLDLNFNNLLLIIPTIMIVAIIVLIFRPTHEEM